MFFKEITEAETFFNTVQNFELIPFTQFKGMYNMHSFSGQNKIHFFINNIENPSIGCFAHEKRFLTKRMLLIEGEAYANQSSINIKTLRSFYTEILQLGYDIIEVCSSATYDFKYETALRQTGFLRPVGQFSMPITKIIDLTKKINYNQNWTRNIKKVKEFNLNIEFIETPSFKDCEDFIDIYKEMIGRKSMTDSLGPEQIFALCKNGDFKLFFSTYLNKRITGIIIHKNTKHAGLLYAATNETALQLSASFFMYDSLFKYLIDNGISTFDMEKLVPSTQSVNSVFLFKNGIDGKIEILNGEWSWYKKSYYRPMMYFVKKYLMKKREL